MDFDIFDINKFNVIQDEENYYFFRALNMADNADIEQQTTTSTDGKIERIRTDRERFDGDAKYTEASEISLEEIIYIDIYNYILTYHTINDKIDVTTTSLLDIEKQLIIILKEFLSMTNHMNIL